MGGLLFHQVSPAVIQRFKDHVNGGGIILKVRLCNLPGFIGDNLYEVVFTGIFVGVPVSIVPELHVKAHLLLLPLG